MLGVIGAYFKDFVLDFHEGVPNLVGLTLIMEGFWMLIVPATFRSTHH